MQKQKRQPTRPMRYEPRYPEYVAPEHPTTATLPTVSVFGALLPPSRFSPPVRIDAMDAYKIKSRGVKC